MERKYLINPPNRVGIKSIRNEGKHPFPQNEQRPIKLNKGADVFVILLVEF